MTPVDIFIYIFERNSIEILNCPSIYNFLAKCKKTGWGILSGKCKNGVYSHVHILHIGLRVQGRFKHPETD